MSRLDRLFTPTSIAIVGASDREGTYAHNTLSNLARAGYAGRLIGVHPTRQTAAGVTCVPTLADAGPVDAVVIATPADSVPDYLEEARHLGCGGAVVYAAGFAEAGRDDLARRFTEAAGDLPVIGPNGNGFVNIAARAPLWGDAARLPDHAGGVALVSESGNIGVIGLAHRQGEGLHSVASMGNAAVVSSAHMVEHLASVEGVRTVALYLEGDGVGADWCRAFAGCAENDVRVVVLKVGRSARGAAVGAAHTAAIVGDHGVFAALVAEAGGVLVNQPHELLETARALSVGRRDRRGVGMLTCSGGDAAIAADLADDLGAHFADFSEATRETLAALLPPAATVANPVDHTSLIWDDTEAVAALTEAVGRDVGVGHLVYVQDEPPGLPEAAQSEWRATRAGGVLGGERAGLTTMLVSTTPGQAPPGAVAGLDNALRALALLQGLPPDPSRLRDIGSLVGSGGDGGQLTESEAKVTLAHRGVAVPRGVVAQTLDEAIKAAAGLGNNVVLKVLAPDLAHKSDVGGVVVDAFSEVEISTAAQRLLNLPSAQGVLVEERIDDGLELLVTARADGVVPTLTIGLGGLWAEALGDVVVVPLPVDLGRVKAALRHLRAWPVLAGARGGQAYDIDALCRAAVAISDLLVENNHVLVEVNPLVLTSREPVALDALIR